MKKLSSKIVLFGLGMMVAAGSARAAVIDVTTTQDVVDQNDGRCSLREAVMSSNGELAWAGAVNECNAGDLFPATNQIHLHTGDYVLTIADDASTPILAQTGDLDIASNLVLVGEGSKNTAIIARGNKDRVVKIFDRVALPGMGMYDNHAEIRGMTLKGGDARLNRSSDLCSHNGGAICVWERQSLTLNDVVVTDNHARAGAGLFGGNAVSIMVDGSAIQGNIADEDMGGIGLRTEGNVSSALVIENSTISGNESSGLGGGIGVRSLNLGIVHGLITNSTVYANGAENGGGIFLDGAAGTASVVLKSDTVAHNKGVKGGGLKVEGNGVTVASVNTILLGNISSIGSPDCHGTSLQSTGSNLFGDIQTCPTAVNPTDQYGADVPSVFAGVLADNGGPTLTVALKPAGAAVDKGDCRGFTADQRGVARPQNGHCDIGAFELEQATTPNQPNQASQIPTTPDTGHSSGFSGAPSTESPGADSNGPQVVNRTAADFTHMEGGGGCSLVRESL